MNLAEAIEIGCELLDKYGLSDWTLCTVNQHLPYGYYGLCIKESKTIRVASRYVVLNSEEWFLELMHHEIAHALVPDETRKVTWLRNQQWYDGHGNKVPAPELTQSLHHGPLWKAKMAELGYPQGRCHNQETIKPRPEKFLAKCPTCSKIYKSCRQPKDPRYCTSCCRKFKVFDVRSKLTYHDIEKLMPETRAKMGL